MARSCVVVGAGAAGLSAAYRLANHGIRVTVLESEPYIGGRTRSERVGDTIINTGAGFLTSFYDRTLALARELGLAIEPARQPPGVVATPFGKLPFRIASARGAWRFPLVPWSSKLRALLLFARWRWDRRAHIADLRSLARLDRGDSVEGWAQRLIGSAGYHYLLRTGIEPFFSFGAEEASSAIGKALMRHAAGWEMLILAGGMGALCEALARRLEVRTGCRVSALEQSTAGVSVHHSGGAVDADYAILALPATAAARLEGLLPDEDRRDLASISYVPSVLLYFGYERPITVQHVAVTPSGPGRHAVSGVHCISHWTPQYVAEGKEVVLIRASGWRSAEVLDLDSDKMIARLRSDAEAIFGRLADPSWIRIYSRREANVVPTPGHYRRMLAFQRRPRERLFYAGDWLSGSTVEGAVRTGLEAAEAILARSS